MPENIVTQTLVIDTAAGEYRYTVTGVTPRCWWLTAGHTGATRQFTSRQALNLFVDALRDHLHQKHGQLVEVAA